MNWPKGPRYWQDGDVLYVSIPFTWDLDAVWLKLYHRDFFWERAVVGGPAVELIPDRFEDLEHVTVGHSMPGVLQRVNPLATRTTIGCPNKCQFCAVPKIDGCFQELDEWPDLPLICDNNLLAASDGHIDRVFDRLEKHDGVDFNQGLDYKRLTEHHAERLLRLNRPKIRLACDSKEELLPWLQAVRRLIAAGIPKSWIHTYALIGWNNDPGEDWTRCEFISKNCRVYPMWFHPLDARVHNGITDKQAALGWSGAARRGIMGYYYMHRGKVREGIEA